MTLLSNVPPSRTRGLKVLTIGILIVTGGFVIAWLGAIDVGWVIAWIGGLTALVGLLWHFWLLLGYLSEKRHSLFTRGDQKEGSDH